MQYIIHYDIAAIILTVVILIHFYHKKSIRVTPSIVFICLTWLSLTTDIMDIITVAIDAEGLAPVFGYVANAVYLSCFNALPFLCYLYLFVATKRREEWQTRDRIILYVPVSCAVFFILSSPMTGLVFHYTLEDGYGHGPGFPLLYVATAIYMSASLRITISYRSRLTKWQRLSVYLYLACSLIGIVLQIILPNILTLQFAISLSLLFLYLSLENPDDDEDKQLEIYNSRGFEKMVSVAVKRREPMYIYVIEITNFHAMREAVGVEQSYAMLKKVIERIRIRDKGLTLFYLSEGRLAVLDRKKGDSAWLVQAIQGELEKPVEFGGMNIHLETVLLRIDYPQEVKSAEDIMDAIDYSQTVPFGSSEGQIMHLSQDILRGKRRENHVLQRMQQALEEKSFQVYYQPIYSVKKQGYCSAEALLRLYDEELGFISPEEFIPVAEKNGMILRIGEFVFREVCAMMARQGIWNKGIEYIEVNLSVVQCMQEDICEMLYGVMDEYGVPYSCINLEITETTLAKDILWNTMERMTVGGVTFSLDDYGTGYSNLTNVLKHPFCIVKLDKSMVWYAMENDYAMKALRHTVAMMRDLNLQIVAEGVENQEQKRTLEEMGCDFLQGFYFSKPVPEKEFLRMLE